MAVGKAPIRQTGAPVDGYVTAIKGQDGRLPPPPKGDLYVRDPRAARADAIRQKVAVYKNAGVKVPEHLQKLLDGLTAADESGVELVDAATGAHVADVKVVEGTPQPSGSGSNTNVFPAEDMPGYKAPAPVVEPVTEPVVVEEVPAEAAPEPVASEVNATSHAGSGTLSVSATAVVPAEPEPSAPAARRPGRPRKAPQKG